MSKIQLFILSTRKKLRLDMDRKIVLGRAEGVETDGTMNIDLSDSMAYQLGVSRRHLMLVPEDDEILAFDLASRNGTTINGTQMLARKGYPLRDGDEIQMGDLVVRVYFRADVPYTDFQTRELPSLESLIHQPRTTKEQGITSPLPDIRNTLNVTQPLNYFEDEKAEI